VHLVLAAPRGDDRADLRARGDGRRRVRGRRRPRPDRRGPSTEAGARRRQAVDAPRMSGVTLIQVPYHLGRKGVVLGAGPEPLAQAIGGDSLVVERSEPLTNEISATFDVIRGTRAAVRETLDTGRFPL